MTTPAAERLYLAQHLVEWEGKGFAVFNPLGIPIADLPVIYGFNNGGEQGWWCGVLLAEDGHCLGGHGCSSEAYMPHDLGIIDGARPDRHETFREHFPKGYRMEFVSGSGALSHPGLKVAFARNQSLRRAAEANAEAERLRDEAAEDGYLDPDRLREDRDEDRRLDAEARRSGGNDE